MSTMMFSSGLRTLQSEVRHLNQFTCELLASTGSDLVTIRWIDVHQQPNDKTAHLLDYASRSPCTIRDEKSIKCYGDFNPVSNWGAVSYPDGITAENLEDEELYKSIRQKATFPIAVDGEVALLVNLLRIAEGESGLADVPFTYREVQNAWANTQYVVSSRFLHEIPIHSQYQNASNQIWRLRHTGDLERFLLGLAQCITSGLGFSWNRVFVFDESTDPKVCKVALGQTTKAAWEQVVASPVGSLGTELNETLERCAGFEDAVTFLNDSLLKVCLASPTFDFEAPHATPAAKTRTPLGWLSSLNGHPLPTERELNNELAVKCRDCQAEYDDCIATKSLCFVVDGKPYLLFVSDSYGSSEHAGAARDILTSVFVKQASEACSEMVESQLVSVEFPCEDNGDQ